MLNAADRKSIRAAEKAAAVADRERGETIINLMRTAPGRRFVWDKLTAAHIFQTSFNIDPGQMAFAEGERNQGLLLLNDIIQWCPDQFIQAMREANERRTIDNVRDITDASSGQRPSGEDANGRDQGPTGNAGDGDPYNWDPDFGTGEARAQA